MGAQKQNSKYTKWNQHESNFGIQYDHIWSNNKYCRTKYDTILSYTFIYYQIMSNLPVYTCVVYLFHMFSCVFFFRVHLTVAKHFIGPTHSRQVLLTSTWKPHFVETWLFHHLARFSDMLTLFFLRAEQMAWPFCRDCPLHFVDLFPLILGRSPCCRFKQVHFIGHSLQNAIAKVSWYSSRGIWKVETQNT